MTCSSLKIWLGKILLSLYSLTLYRNFKTSWTLWDHHQNFSSHGEHNINDFNLLSCIIFRYSFNSHIRKISPELFSFVWCMSEPNQLFAAVVCVCYSPGLNTVFPYFLEHKYHLSNDILQISLTILGVLGGVIVVAGWFPRRHTE